MLVAVHEFVEATICQHSGVSQEIVDAYDLNFAGGGEPGDQANCPYAYAHSIASGVERILAAALGVNWQQYEKRVDALSHQIG